MTFSMSVLYLMEASLEAVLFYLIPLIPFKTFQNRVPLNTLNPSLDLPVLLSSQARNSIASQARNSIAEWISHPALEMGKVVSSTLMESDSRC